jgi:glycerol-3-phosphate cytidylyltransferase
MIVGFTAGVFDMFHVGHLNLIENARKRCDYLIVGVNSDELVASYKDKKAVVPFEERFRIVKAIRYVDEAVRVDTLDKETLWREKPFDLLFIGDDWKGNPRWQKTERDMLALGVRTLYLPYTVGTTSTILRDKISNEVQP